MILSFTRAAKELKKAKVTTKKPAAPTAAAKKAQAKAQVPKVQKPQAQPKAKSAAGLR